MSKEIYTKEEVKGMIQMIYSEFAELPRERMNHIELKRIIELEVEKHPLKPIKIFK